MDDFELPKRIEAHAPDPFVQRRLAAYDAVADAGISWAVNPRSPRRAEVRIARELRQDIHAARAAWASPTTPDEHAPQLLRQLHSLLHISRLIPALIETTGDQDLDSDLVQALRTAAHMCGGFDRPLSDLDALGDGDGPGHHAPPAEPGAQRLPSGVGTPRTGPPPAGAPRADSLRTASRHALTALLLLDKQLLSKIAQREGADEERSGR
ncbi:hypothetical protein [Streptomyces sp. SP18CS02]|uniref:hypothetical protein n=1 Tax=Streptomyces sp. SP18CS02 TaxID=3002531 RepID=UPI002E761316|nr:hypothetical protein [Streptomyces sp. SP18CS02]MEE1754619.1 hypothetical protein [Streptomyces sp. SP18CS02]